MKYIGSKSRLVKEILPLILKNRKPGQYYVEPFCGSCSVIQNVDGPRIASDNHYYLIELLTAIQLGWTPPDEITEEEYNKWKFFYKEWILKENYGTSPMVDPMIGFIGFCCSFAGKWWGGYARGNDNKGNPRNYADEQKRNLLKQIPLLKGIEFKCCNYKDLEIPPNSLIYADPPYSGTTKYSTSKEFNHDEFWNWCREKYQDGHNIFISEYEAPRDFNSVWQKEIVSSLDKNTGGKRGIEKLFVPAAQLEQEKK